MNSILKSRLQNSRANTIELLYNSHQFHKNYEKAVKQIVKRIQNGGTVYSAGNGGSASDSLHLTGELVCKIKKSRSPVSAESLCSDIATITAIANDFSYDLIFSRQLEAKSTKKDVFIGISTSGNSQNIVEAMKVCKGLRILLTGPNNACKAAQHCDIILSVPGTTADEIQEMHQIVYHSLVYDIEMGLGL